MDQTTHNVHRANWLTISTQCQERPKGISVKQWFSDNGVKEKAYHYWLRKFCKEACAQMPPRLQMKIRVMKLRLQRYLFLQKQHHSAFHRGLNHMKVIIRSFLSLKGGELTRKCNNNIIKMTSRCSRNVNGRR